MGNTTKTKAAMLNELESIKGLLLEEDDIPILQEEVLEQQTEPTSAAAGPQAPETKMAAQAKAATRTIFEEQQDFFQSHSISETNHNHSDHEAATAAAMDLVDRELLDTLNELEKHTAEVTAGKPIKDSHKHTFERPNLAKATGENPFLPEHIRARLHGNNPPPLFANVTARKIANSSVPSRQLGNTLTVGSSAKSNHQQDIIGNVIESIIEKMMPEIELELRSRLELMSKNLLDELNK
ncbi:MAG TPA: hypothetical protein PK002_09060 [Cellvibrio sp.]|nr:hypothetical protein [Cellvibrio sp.]